MALAPSPVHVRRSWKAMLADDAEALAFAHCWNATDRSLSRVCVHPKSLGGAPIHLRPGTTDAQVLDDTFVGLYHLPPVPLAEDAVVLDLGGNVGHTAGHFAAMWPRGRVVCVEMDESNAAAARQNLEWFGARCEVIHAAVWDQPGWLAYDGAEEWGFRVSGLGAGGSSLGSRRCPAETVESILTRLGIDRVDYAKVDIEGAEDRVVTPGARWLACVRSIKVEYHAPATRESMRAALEGAGFDVRDDERHSRCVAGVRG